MSGIFPEYNGKDQKVMQVMVPAFTLILNTINFGSAYISSIGFFLGATLLTLAALTIDFMLCGFIAVLFKRRLPKESQILMRLSIMIFIYLILTGLFLYALLNLYEAIPFFQYRFEEKDLFWSYFSMGIINVFLTFLMEGISRYNTWEASWQENERIHRSYKQSQLEGLKSQVNPHFLFNSLNSLSSLIQEDAEKAEVFLDEMSKVYRYMLRDETQWVPLETELKFVGSYMHLLKSRFGDALQLRIDIPAQTRQLLIAPLTLQIIIENAFTQNIASKLQPLEIALYGSSASTLTICNSVQHKTITESVDYESGLDNLINKYKLLGYRIEVDDHRADRRCIAIPLITANTPTTA